MQTGSLAVGQSHFSNENPANFSLNKGIKLVRPLCPNHRHVIDLPAFIPTRAFVTCSLTPHSDSTTPMKTRLQKIFRLVHVPTFSITLSLFAAPLLAETTTVAVASNFTAPMTEIAKAFEQDTGHEVKLSFGSSGKFVAQIHHGAPYDAFLSADQDKPERLIKMGSAVEGSQFTYALGALVLWTTNPDIQDPKAALVSGSFNKLALANPKLAPYGAAAMQVLEATGSLKQARLKMVKGENISQTWQFVATGNVDLGFIAGSQHASYLHKKLESNLESNPEKKATDSYWSVPAELHQPIRQDAVLLKRGESNPAAQALLSYLGSESAQAIMARFGYGFSSD